MSTFRTETIKKFIFETGLSLVGATNTKIYYVKPDGTNGNWTATVNGTKLEYQVQEGNLDADGLWHLQGYFELSGAKSYTDKVEHYVYKPINL